MSVLLVRMQVRGGEEEALVEAYRSVFVPAISAQAGFDRVRLLRPEDTGVWTLEIEFADEPHRLAWVASDLHQSVWPQLEVHCETAVPELYQPAQ